ncbi:hypothetical protein L3Y34_009705 [Caenorhabditis briggsae]|uniref:PAN-3 domain-containing protein n=1 Tax=Caenorhabditis briggsae TaxID=6238 RepID=A0AAE9A397_CAEBR|nr:hypothetical protein L3Y34_009705 [Caenorhabditis briggsae]
MYPKVVHFHTPDHPIYVVACDWEIREWIGYRQLISLGTVIVEGSTFLFLLHFNIWWSTKRMTMSQNTLGMQRRFLKAVYMQIAIPATIMIVPQIIMILLGYLYLNTTEMNSIAYMLMAIHGASATLIMLYFHAPYRDFCGKLFCRNTKKVEVKHISTSGTESSDPYKMVVVSGKPQNSPLFQSMKFDFSTCVDYCLTKDNCMAVYSKNLAVEDCQVYYNVQLDSIVAMDKSAGVKTAFKVSERHEKCAKAQKMRQGTKNTTKQQKCVNVPRIRQALKMRQRRKTA